MGIQRFAIEAVHNPAMTYYPGETIFGLVRILADEDFKVEGLKMIYGGKASAEWVDADRTKDERTHFVEEIIFSTHKYIFTVSGRAGKVLPPGSHEFPFEFKLPKGLPTSFVNKESRVRYDMEACLERGGWKSSIKARLPFTVKGSLDLNGISGIGEHVGIRVSRNLSCFFCSKGLVGFEVCIPKQGYVCGEYVEFVVEIFNQSRRKVKGFLASLVQKAIYRARALDRGSTFSKVICSAQGPSVEPGERERWRGYLLKIPALPPSHLATSSLRVLDIQYTLRMELILPGSGDNLSYEFPITIGTIPIRSRSKNVPGFRGNRYRFGRQSVQFSDPLVSSRMEYPHAHREEVEDDEAFVGEDEMGSPCSENLGFVQELTDSTAMPYGRELQDMTNFSSSLSPSPSPTNSEGGDSGYQ